MKKGLLMLFLICLGSQAYCQDKSKGELNFTFSKGTSEILRTQLDGAGNYDGDGFYGLGLSYLKPLNSWLDVEAGIAYSENKIKFTSGVEPSGSKTFNRSQLSLLAVPVTFRANFMKYFFVNLGVVADFATSNSIIDNQSGIGALAGLGFKYNFTPRVSAYANPYLQQHAIIPFRAENYQQRMLDAGVKFGVGLKL